ncbi:Hachiman antiphage defense system protein HamA [Sorangium sp. So ce281]|uniref:Hachiman antiphage defense system protein HamA n=1 Tax=unclassified Sorangium TaxID=2621164 RepID=UPI003F627D9D
MAELPGMRAGVLDEVRNLVRSHYVSPEITAKRLTELGAPKTAQLLREHVPTTKTARSGDLGEVLATEIAEQTLKFTVPIRRLRWKDGRNMALRGDDIVGIRDTKGKLDFLKGESKSRASLTSGVLDEAAAALDRDRGRPSRHAVLFVAERLRELSDDALAARLESAVLGSFSGSSVEHFLLALTGSNPDNLLTTHLTAAAKKKRTRHAVGIRIADHEAFIDLLFRGL